MTKTLRLINIPVILFILAFTHAALAQSKTYPYGPELVELTGIIQKATFYGPPNYGEDPKNDTKENILVIVLNEPININSKSDIDFNIPLKDIKRLQIIPHDLSKQLNQLINKQVKLKGTLMGAQTGHHHTEALIQLKQIERI